MLYLAMCQESAALRGLCRRLLKKMFTNDRVTVGGHGATSVEC